MGDNCGSTNAFAVLGKIFTAWEKVCDETTPTAKDAHAGDIVENMKRLRSVETLLALGYAVRHTERNGRSIPQAHIVNELAVGGKTRDSVRMSVSRRMAALEFVGLINRHDITPTHVEFEPTCSGLAVAERLNEALANFEPLEEGGPKK